MKFMIYQMNITNNVCTTVQCSWECSHLMQSPLSKHCRQPTAQAASY